MWLLWSGNILQRAAHCTNHTQSLISDFCITLVEWAQEQRGGRLRYCTLINMCSAFCGKVVRRPLSRSFPHMHFLLSHLSHSKQRTAEWVAGQRGVRMSLEIMNKSAAADNKNALQVQFPRLERDESGFCVYLSLAHSPTRQLANWFIHSFSRLRYVVSRCVRLLKWTLDLLQSAALGLLMLVTASCLLSHNWVAVSQWVHSVLQLCYLCSPCWLIEAQYCIA